MKKKIRLFIVDGHELFCESVIHSLEEFGIFVIKGYSLNGDDALKKIGKSCQYLDVVFIESNLADMSGFELAASIKKLCHNLKLVLLSGEICPEHIDQALHCRMDGVLSKKISLNTFFRAIINIHNGERVIQSGSGRKEGHPGNGNTELNTGRFTKREFEIIQSIAKGRKTKEIAKSLFISYKTVENHRANILQKSGANNMVELINDLIKKNYI